jgi:thymidylate synthase (FAD)
LGKHQAGLSWNEVSRRYVDTPPEFYTPDEWRERPEGGIKQGSSGVIADNEPAKRLYASLVNESVLLYNSFIDNNVAPEMARMVLPQSMMTTWYWTGNLLAFAHVYKERISESAQLEARHFAKELDAIIAPLFPISWKALTGVKE